MGISLYRDRILDKFGAKFLEINKGTLEDFLIDNEENIIILFNKLNQKGDLYLNDFNKKNDKSKKRWVSSELDKINSSFFNEVRMANDLYEKLKKESNEEIFEKIYFCKNPEEYLGKNKQKLLDWSERSSFFIDFPYIKSKRMSAIRPAICNDIVVYLLNISKQEDKSIIKIPYMLQEIPEDTTNRIKVWNKKDEINDKDEIEDIDKQIYYNEETGEKISLTIKKNEYLSFFSGGGITELDREIRTEIVKQLKVFNSLDRDILQYVLLQTREIYTADTIERDLGDIAISIGKKNNESNQKNIKNSLYKLGSSGYSKNGKFVGRFFSVKIIPVKDKHGFREVARIYVDGMLREVILTNNTFNFYTDKFNLLSKDAQKILITLQNERILRVLDDNQDLFLLKTLSDFKKAIYFQNKRTMKPRIISALDELVKYKMGVKSYEIVDKYEIRLEFFRFPEQDIKLIKGKDFKYGDFVDGSYDLIH